MENLKVIVLVVVSIVCVLGGASTMLPNLFNAERHESYAVASEDYAGLVQAGAVEYFEAEMLLDCGLTYDDFEDWPTELDDVDCQLASKYIREHAETQRQIRNNYIFAFGFSTIAFVFGLFNILTGFWFWRRK